MKLRQRLTTIKNDFRKLLQQKGQSLVEFVLLLAVISMLSYSFVAVINSNLGTYWEHCVNIVVNDGDPGKPKLTID
jgi:competence protein ComGC